MFQLCKQETDFLKHFSDVYKPTEKFKTDIDVLLLHFKLFILCVGMCVPQHACGG